MIVNNIYKNCVASGRWEYLRSNQAEVICPKTIDFSLTDPKESNYLLTALKIVLLPWLIYEAIRYVAQRLMMTRIYPAQSALLKAIIPEFRTGYLDKLRQKEVERLTQKGFIVRHVAFERNGNKISGLLITHSEQAGNGKWVLQAAANVQPVELGAALTGEFYHTKKYNVLLLNNPGVGRSEGTATPDTIGDTQEMGIQFLESVLKAKKIILAGFSIGGGAISQAILKHTFEKDKHEYAVIRQMSFNRISDVCKHVLNFSYAPALVRWAGCEIDSVAASRKLQELRIPEAIIQSTDEQNQPCHDGTIPSPATLHWGLQNELDIDETKKFIGLLNAQHFDEQQILSATSHFIHLWDKPVTLWHQLSDRFTQFVRGLQPSWAI